MPTPEVRQITLVPFMFSGPCNHTGPNWRRLTEDVCKEAGGSEAALSDVEAAQFGSPVPAKILFDCAGARLALYLFPVGMGVFQVHWPVQEAARPAPPAGLLGMRRTRHHDLMRGTDAVGARLHTIIAHVWRLARPDVRLPAFVLKDLRPCQYVFSMYCLRPESDESDEECGRLVRELLQPSRRGISDNEWDRLQEVDADNADAGRAPNMKEWDLRQTVNCQMSWASVVVKTRTDLAEVAALYGALESRLQAAWCLTHIISGIEGFHQHVTSYEAEVVSATLETGLRELASLRDATASERVKVLYEGMVETSGLTTRIDEARRHVEMLRDFAGARASRRRERFELVAELLLFLLVCLQLLPLVQKDPLEGTMRTLVITGVGISFVAYVVLRSLMRR